MNKDQFQQLIRQVQDRVKSDPANPDAWRDLAQAKMMAGDIDGAEDDCIECLRLNPQNVGGLILMGNLLTNCRKNDEAAKSMYEMKNRGGGDNLSKTTRGIIHRITYRAAA